MNVRDWRLFIEGHWENEIAVAQLSRELARYLGASSDKVYLHQDYARKAVRKHGLGFEHLNLIFEAVDYGMALVEPERPRHMTFLYFDTLLDADGAWYQATVKRGGEDRRIFLATFHRSCATEAARKRRKLTILRGLELKGRP